MYKSLIYFANRISRICEAWVLEASSRADTLILVSSTSSATWSSLENFSFMPCCPSRRRSTFFSKVISFQGLYIILHGTDIAMYGFKSFSQLAIHYLPNGFQHILVNHHLHLACPVYPGLYSVVNGKQLCRLLVGVTGFLLAEPMEMLSHLRISCSIIQQKQSSIKHQKTVWQIYIRA